jgi:hypothetical protein
MKEYEDPLLVAFDEEQKKSTAQDSSSEHEDTSSEEESGSEDELSDIVFPKDDATKLLQFIMRDLNNLTDKEDK